MQAYVVIASPPAVVGAVACQLWELVWNADCTVLEKVLLTGLLFSQDVAATVAAGSTCKHNPHSSRGQPSKCHPAPPESSLCAALNVDSKYNCGDLSTAGVIARVIRVRKCQIAARKQPQCYAARNIAAPFTALGCRSWC